MAVWAVRLFHGLSRTLEFPLRLTVKLWIFLCGPLFEIADSSNSWQKGYSVMVQHPSRGVAVILGHR